MVNLLMFLLELHLFKLPDVLLLVQILQTGFKNEDLIYSLRKLGPMLFQLMVMHLLSR